MVEQLDEAMQGPADPGPRVPGSFADGYSQGQEDVLYALAAGHQWALDKLAEHRAKPAKHSALNALINKEWERVTRPAGPSVGNDPPARG